MITKFKNRIFWKNGQITNQFKNLRIFTFRKKKEFASSLNKLKDNLTSQIENKNFRN